MTTRQFKSFATPTLLALLLTACGGGGGGPPEGMQMPPQPVAVATVVQRDVTRWDEFNGRVEAIETVEIRPQARS